jgi:DNA-binding MarR family transcriptional regulator
VKRRLTKAISSRQQRVQDSPPPLTVTRPELLVKGSDREFRGFVHDMLAFAARIEAVREGFASVIGLTGIRYTMLVSARHLEHDGPVNINDIAEHLHLSGAFVTIETGKLLRAGLLTKTRDEKDRRRVCVKVTPKGMEKLRALSPLQVKINNVLFGCLDAAQFQEFRQVMHKMVDCGDRALSLFEYLSTGGRL